MCHREVNVLAIWILLKYMSLPKSFKMFSIPYELAIQALPQWNLQIVDFRFSFIWTMNGFFCCFVLSRLWLIWIIDIFDPVVVDGGGGLLIQLNNESCEIRRQYSAPGQATKFSRIAGNSNLSFYAHIFLLFVFVFVFVFFVFVFVFVYNL